VNDVEATAYHQPVLLHETLELLLTDLDGTYVDGTLGGGGHAEAILKSLSTSGKLIGIDQDEDALQAAGKRLAQFGSRAHLHRSNFSRVKDVLSQSEIEKVTGVLLDLGVSSFQLNEASKGFSFRADAPLDMRMDRSQRLSAMDVVNEYSTEQLADVLWKYGEERNSRRIARTVEKVKMVKKIETTMDLAAIVEKAVGGKFLTKSLARVFQAIRIEVNNELKHLQRGLTESIDALKSGGRLVVISYHSLEDRIVKDTFRKSSADSERATHALLPDIKRTPNVTLLTRKPVEATEEEIEGNRRARSAKLRAVEKL
jgi:16S rRNA (cytosine1402-N4)-methyltransferase